MLTLEISYYAYRRKNSRIRIESHSNGYVFLAMRKFTLNSCTIETYHLGDNVLENIKNGVRIASQNVCIL